MNEYFDKIYVLSLRRSKDRRETVSDRLKAVNIEFEFFDAYDGKVMNFIWNRLGNNYFKNPNYFACNVSHLAIYNDALSNGYKRILILEDDVKPHKDINTLFDMIKGNIPLDYDLLYLGYIPLNDREDEWDYNIFNDRYISTNVFKAKNLWGLYSYSITENLMRGLVDLYNSDFPMELDRYFVHNLQRTGDSFATSPQLFCHDITVSTNEELIDYSSLRKSVDFRYADTSDYI